jgi:prepilin-type N-terminal cleavage/methylation domain-containing protein
MIKLLKKTNGFTLIEVIAVLIVIGIITAAVVVSMTTTSASLAGYTALLKTHLRYAQTLAMNSDTGGLWGIRADVANEQYWLFQCADPLNCDSTAANSEVLPVEDADGSNRILLANESLNLVSLTAGPAVSFDTNGIPYQGTTSFSALTADLVITLADTSTGETRTITITQQTGFIP